MMLSMKFLSLCKYVNNLSKPYLYIPTPSILGHVTMFRLAIHSLHNKIEVNLPSEYNFTIERKHFYTPPLLIISTLAAFTLIILYVEVFLNNKINK